MSELRYVPVQVSLPDSDVPLPKRTAMMLGGNIQEAKHPCVIAKGKGSFELGLALGILPLPIALTVNLLFHLLKNKPEY
ncbi:hypothetical protein [Methyloglobulus sp.]|uniref:hypothetical protein n=1 Tax=Methyloglobulus sp. TaxID=2518622 RepID=UPI0032B795E3